ncbi:MAG: type III-A CRISPR-associated protein Cas10/Csm1 [Syntrophales bacterium]|nr:type III-A CRISPR-associated protein Cas10/Csm1 [Syntrophales bacterium]
MKETVLKVALGGLIHDIGKLTEDVMEVSVDYLDRHASLYQPSFDGHYTHRHAVYTAAFIEWCEKILPRQLNQASWGLEDTFVKVAAGHHKPETPLQWIIAVADRLSAGLDRSTFEKEYNEAVNWSDYRKTRLLSLFERLNKDGKVKREDYLYAYGLKEVNPESIFPQKKEIVRPPSDEEAKNEYRKLFQEFCFALEKLAHRNENIYLWFDHFESLMSIYLSFIPQARAGYIIPDVSLYDHSRMVAAIASALYLYHKETNTYDKESIKDDKPKKFLLVGGDFYGIQGFIFNEGEAAKYRAKMLRGRSFAVSLYCELAADLILRKMDLPSTSLIISAGGKFYIILPNTEKAKKNLEEAENQINSWLLDVSLGESCIGITSMELAPVDLIRPQFAKLWEELSERMWKKKFSRFSINLFGGEIKGYLEKFRPLDPPLCPYCGKRPSSEKAEEFKESEDRSMCEICHDHIYLGKNIAQKRGDLRVAITHKEAAIRGEKLLAPIFDEYQVAFTDGLLNDLARDGLLYKYWDVNADPLQPVNKTVTVRFIAGYVPTYREEDKYDERILAGRKSERKKERLIAEIEVGRIKTFEHIAAKALNYDDSGKEMGISALGVLKADVDHLGQLMACGIPEDDFSISRVASLSRMLNLFFALYLPYLLKKESQFNDIYTIFAGGDDLFLIGPWNRVVELVAYLNGKFADYVCHNPEIHFSAGMSLQKPNTPIVRLAEDAEEVLSQSKANGRNSITIFGSTAKWSEFFKLTELRETLQEWSDRKLVNSAMLFRINKFIEMAEKESKVCQEGGVTIRDMECLKWRALFRYMTERNIGRTMKSEEERHKARREFSKVYEWLHTYREKLRIPLWGLIYNIRRGGRS